MKSTLHTQSCHTFIPFYGVLILNAVLRVRIQYSILQSILYGILFYIYFIVFVLIHLLILFCIAYWCKSPQDTIWFRYEIQKYDFCLFEYMEVSMHTVV